MMVYMQMLDTINIHNQPVNYDRLVLDFNKTQLFVNQSYELRVYEYLVVLWKRFAVNVFFYNFLNVKRTGIDMKFISILCFV